MAKDEEKARKDLEARIAAMTRANEQLDSEHQRTLGEIQKIGGTMKSQSGRKVKFKKQQPRKKKKQR